MSYPYRPMASITEVLKSIWPPACGPFMLAPVEVVADWYEEQGDAATAAELRDLAAYFNQLETNESVKWRY